MRRIHQSTLVATTFLAVLLQVAALVAPGCATSRSAEGRTTIRVMTWNIHHARGIDEAVDINRIARLILKEKVDIVALQEIDRGVERSQKVDIITELADLTQLTYAFGKTIDFQGGQYGNGFLTRFPILEESNRLYAASDGKEQRGALILLLDCRGQEFAVANTHLDSGVPDSTRFAAANELIGMLRRYESRPTILFGDLNDVPESRTLGTLEAEFADAWETAGAGSGFTYPSQKPAKRIDYVLSRRNPRPDSNATPLLLRPVVARIVASDASDHLPLIVEFTLSTE